LHLLPFKYEVNLSIQISKKSFSSDLSIRDNATSYGMKRISFEDAICDYSLGISKIGISVGYLN